VWEKAREQKKKDVYQESDWLFIFVQSNDRHDESCLFLLRRRSFMNKRDIAERKVQLTTRKDHQGHKFIPEISRKKKLM
jgi:hypothetical protein